MITGKTKLLGVIGYPVEHSLSPRMHNAAIATRKCGTGFLHGPLKFVPLSPESSDPHNYAHEPTLSLAGAIMIYLLPFPAKQQWLFFTSNRFTFASPGIYLNVTSQIATPGHGAYSVPRKSVGFRLVPTPLFRPCFDQHVRDTPRT